MHSRSLMRLLSVFVLLALLALAVGNPAHHDDPEIEAGHEHESLAEVAESEALPVVNRRGNAPSADKPAAPKAPVALHDQLDTATHERPPVPAAPDAAGDPSNLRAVERPAAISARVADLSRELEETRARLRSASALASEREERLEAAEASARSLRDQLAAARGSGNTAQSATRERLQRALRDRTRAFDELLEEKKLLSRELRKEQGQLVALQERIRDPSLGAWVRRRAERAAVLLDSPETDALAYYAQLYMRPRVARMRHRLEVIEKRLEMSVDHVLPAKYGAPVAVLLLMGLFAFPILAVFRVTLTLSSKISLRQYLLLGNVFLVALAFSCCVARVLLRQDPLKTLYQASEQAFLFLQLLIGLAFPMFLLLLAVIVYKARRRGNAYIFACEFVFYFMVGLNYRRRVWEPAMVGEVIHSNTMMYVVYLVDFVCMTMLTVSAANSGNGLPPTFTRKTNVPYLPTFTGEQSGIAAAAGEAKRSN